MSGWIWDALGIKPTRDEREIRRAYARKLKVTNPEDDPEGFKALREAYDHALARLQSGSSRHAPRAAPRPPAPPVKQTQTRVSAPEQAEGDIDSELAVERRRLEEHEHLRKALVARLRSDIRDNEATLVALMAVLRSPAMTSLKVHEQTEALLIDLILNEGGASDVLIAPAIAFFEWDNARIGGENSRGRPVIQLRDDLEAIQRLLHPDFYLHKAFQALSRPVYNLRLFGYRLTPGLRESVTKLFAAYDVDRGPLAGRLDPEAVAWWRKHLFGPRIGPWSFWMTGLGPFLALGVLSAGAPPDAPYDAGAQFAAWFAFQIIAVLLLLGIHFVLVRPRWAWLRDGGEWDAPAWQRLGWAPLALSVTPLSILGSGPVFLAVVATPAAVALGWSWIVRPTRDLRALPALVVALLLQRLGILAFCLVAYTSVLDRPGGDVFLVSLAAMLAFVFSQGHLQNMWFGATPRQRRIAVGSLAVAAGGLSLLVPIAVAAPLPGLVAGTTFAFALVALALLEVLPPWIRRTFVMAQFFIVIFVTGLSHDPAGDNVVVGLELSRWVLWTVVAIAVATFIPLSRPAARRRF